MNLLDSNIVIYAAAPEFTGLRALLVAEPFAISVVTIVEVLGYHQLATETEADLRAFLSACVVFDANRSVAEAAVALRRRRKITLADALIAATALTHGCELMTRNVGDFRGIEGLKLVNPVDG